MKDLKIIKNSVKRFIVGVTALLLMTGGANATFVESGNLVVNLDQEVFKSFGVPGGVNTIIEHYFDQTAGNASTGTQLLTDHLDHLEILGDYSNLIFGINDFDSRLGPVIGATHQLQGTTFEFSESTPPSGQIGFGGLLRLGFPVAGTTIDAGFGEIAIGDFTLSYGDRSAGAENASGWLFTTTGLPDSAYFALWDTSDVTVSIEEDTLIITGKLLWSPEAISFLGAFGGPISIEAGTFSIAAETFEKNPMRILDQIVALKAASWSQVSDRPVRITANAPLAQAIHYINIAAANYRQNKFSIGNKYLKLVMSSINKFKSILELGISKGKFSEAEVQSLLETADSIISEIHYLMDNPD